MLGITGANVHHDLPPMSVHATTAMAWEFRYGSVTLKERYSLFSLGAGHSRPGPAPVVIDAVGASRVYGHYDDGRPVVLPASDLRRGWMRVEGST
jgi:hypothetical protein